MLRSHSRLDCAGSSRLCRIWIMGKDPLQQEQQWGKFQGWSKEHSSCVVQWAKALWSGRTVELAVFGQGGDLGKGKAYRIRSLPTPKTSKEKCIGIGAYSQERMLSPNPKVEVKSSTGVKMKFPMGESFQTENSLGESKGTTCFPLTVLVVGT